MTVFSVRGPTEGSTVLFIGLAGYFFSIFLPTIILAFLLEQKNKLKLFPVRAFSMILICTDIKVHFVVLKEIPALRFVKSNFHTSRGTFSGNVFRVLLWKLLTYL